MPSGGKQVCGMINLQICLSTTKLVKILSMQKFQILQYEVRFVSWMEQLMLVILEAPALNSSAFENKEKHITSCTFSGRKYRAVDWFIFAWLNFRAFSFQDHSFQDNS